MIDTFIIQSSIIAVPVFFILLLVIWVSLASASLFGKAGNFLIAICVSILCIVGMFGFMSPSPTHRFPAKKTITKPGIESSPITPSAPSSAKPDKPQKHWFFLLPYEALGVTILAGVLILALSKLHRSKYFSWPPSKNKAAGNSSQKKRFLQEEVKRAERENDVSGIDSSGSMWSTDDKTKR